ncbi:unnamed protein product, partial [Laminaria digitata]
MVWERMTRFITPLALQTLFWGQTTWNYCRLIFAVLIVKEDITDSRSRSCYKMVWERTTRIDTIWLNVEQRQRHAVPCCSLVYCLTTRIDTIWLNVEQRQRHAVPRCSLVYCLM